MKLDIKKICKTPKDQWEAIELMNEAQQKLLKALHIMDSIITCNTPEDRGFNEKRIKDFIKQFE